MIVARRVLAPIVLCVLLAGAAGCSKPQSASSGGPSAEPVASATAAPTVDVNATAAPEAEASPGAETLSPTPEPTASPNPNLLSPQNGTVLRAYPPSLEEPQTAVKGFRAEQTEKGPWVFVYELPGVATLSRVSATVMAKTETGQGSSVTFAVSTSGPATGFSDVATISSGATSDEQTVSLAAPRARWVRATVSRTANGSPLESMAVIGTLGPPPSIPIAGTYVQYKQPYTGGTFASAPAEKDPWYLQVVTAPGGGINGEQCFDGHLGDTYPGTFDGRVWSWQRSEKSTGTYVANDDGSLLVGWDGNPTYWVRTTAHPKYCVPQVFGSGANNVVVLESKSWHALYPTRGEDDKGWKDFRFAHIGAGMVDQSLLASASTVIFNGLCDFSDEVAPLQGRAIMDWVQNGHKLLITDSDMCTKTNYTLLPYPFKSDNPGAHGAKGDRLIQVEDDSLGTSDKSDTAHFFDPLVFAQGSNQLGDANTVTTHDPHWCGHLFGTNANHVNGFMQMYALYGKGLIIFDGFDHDDGGSPSYERIRSLELRQPIPADLPCTQKASLGFVIQPNRDGNFTPGKPATLNFAMELLANQGWQGHVNVTTSGDFRAAVTPSSFDVTGGTQPLKIAVSVPANAKPGQYAVIVNGDGGSGQSAQATIQLHAAVPLVKQIKSQRRIRIYGIHFDVDKATIKPQSEPVIAQIAQVMKQNPKWRFRVEGHTDSDGGLQHNQVLSQNRAQAVVNDLVKRYHIAKSRLVPMGFGYSKPVAPNTTPAGKALNRRVELFLLNP